MSNTYSPSDIVGFGKYRNLTWQQLAERDARYLRWLLSTELGPPNSDTHSTRGPGFVAMVQELLKSVPEPGVWLGRRPRRNDNY